MAIIKCNECGNKISDKASTCPNCGAPNTPKPQPIAQKKKPSAIKRGCLILAISVIALFILVIAGGLMFEKGQKKYASNPSNTQAAKSHQSSEEEKNKIQEAKQLIARYIQSKTLKLTASDLRTKQNPKGEGLIVYYPNMPLIWIILKDKAYAMNGKSAQHTPDIPFPIKAPEDEWAKTGLDKFSLDEEIIKFVWGENSPI